MTNIKHKFKIGESVTINASWCQVYGYSRDKIYRVIDDTDAGFPNGGVVRLEPTSKSPDGTLFWNYQVDHITVPDNISYDIA